MRRAWGRRKYRTTNWNAYNAALKVRGELTIWLDKDMSGWPRPAVSAGAAARRSRMLPSSFAWPSNACLDSSLRQTLGLVQSLLKMVGLPWVAPDHSTVCRRQKACMFECTAAQATMACICLPTPLVSSSWAKVSARQRSTVQNAVASGVRWIWVLMPWRYRFRLSLSPRMM